MFWRTLIQLLIASAIVNGTMPWPEPAASYRFWAMAFVLIVTNVIVLRAITKEQRG